MTRSGLALGDVVLPLHAGTMHYYRVPPADWGAGLDALAGLGLRLVDTYVPWGVHERTPGVFEFGELEPMLDVARFLRMAHARGLYAIVRPGPHINAELTYFGIPEWVVWDDACQAKTPAGAPVVLPIPPRAFPVPSYASEAFFARAARFLAAAAERLAPLLYPDGPVVLVQLDNEGAFYFRDGAYDQDYHPDAITAYRAAVRARFGSSGALAAAYGDETMRLESVTPPGRFDARTIGELARHLDWAEFQEELVPRALERFDAVLAEHGLFGLPTMHNLPPAEASTVLSPEKVAGVVSVVGLDLYHAITPSEHDAIVRRTTELATLAEAHDVPAYGAEVGTGFAPYYPPLTRDDSFYTLLCALAYGLRGMNLYMAVERDRWVGAPIDVHGTRRPHAARYERLLSALDKLRFSELRRHAPVRLVVPRSLRRIGRATHAFGPLSPAAFLMTGRGFTEGCIEDDFGLGEPPAIAGEAFLRDAERELRAMGVPFAYDGGHGAWAPGNVAWLLCPTSGGVDDALLARLRAARDGGITVTVGPTAPTYDERFVRRALPPDALAVTDDVAVEVRRIASMLALPRLVASPNGISLAMHEDENGAPRALFVLNPGAEAMTARFTIPGVAALRELLEGGAAEPVDGAFEAFLPPKTARLFAVERAP